MIDRGRREQPTGRYVVSLVSCDVNTSRAYVQRRMKDDDVVSGFCKEK
jgi:hypothetical protein